MIGSLVMNKGEIISMNLFSDENKKTDKKKKTFKIDQKVYSSGKGANPIQSF